MLHIAHSFLKIFEYLFFFSPKNIIKRSNLYELRELFNFFLKIFHLEFFREKNAFSIFLKKFANFFFEILNFGYFKLKNVVWRCNRKNLSKISTKNFNYFFGMILKSSSLGYRLSFFKNFTLIFKRWIFGKLTIGLTFLNFIKSSIKHIKSFQFSYLNGISFPSWSYRKFSKNAFQIELLEKSFQNKNLEKIFSFISYAFFSFNEFVNFLYINYIELQIPWDSKEFLLYNSNMLVSSQRKKHKFVNAEKFLIKIKKHKTFKECIQGLNFCLFVEKNFNLGGIFFKSLQYRILYLPKFRIHKILLEIYQKNLNMFFELDQLKKNLVLIAPSKIFMVTTSISKTINNYSLFLFKILHYLYILKFKILNNLFSIEKTSEKGYKHDKYSYMKVKIEVLGVQKTINEFKHLNLKIKNLHFTTIMVIRMLVKVAKKFKKKTALGSKYFKKYLFRIENIESIKQENIFLEKLNYWQKIFENRLNCFIYCFIELKISKVRIKFFEFNEFSFRQIGL